MIDPTFLQDSVTPWFDVQTATRIGAYGGGLLGSLAGIVGACAGVFAPRGKGRPLIMGAMYSMAGLGVISLGFGITALVLGQPYAVWYPFLLIGLILGVLGFVLTPITRQRYQQAEQRRIEAEVMRRS